MENNDIVESCLEPDDCFERAHSLQHRKLDPYRASFMHPVVNLTLDHAWSDDVHDDRRRGLWDYPFVVDGLRLEVSVLESLAVAPHVLASPPPVPDEYFLLAPFPALEPPPPPPPILACLASSSTSLSSSIADRQGQRW